MPSRVCEQIVGDPALQRRSVGRKTKIGRGGTRQEASRRLCFLMSDCSSDPFGDGVRQRLANLLHAGFL